MRIRTGKTIHIERIIFILFCCVPPVVSWLIFYVYGNLSSFGMAFTDRMGNFSTENFVRFWQELASTDSEIRLAFRNTFLTFGIQMLCFPFQVMVSYFLYKKIPGSKIYRFLFLLPSMFCAVATTMALQRIVSVRGFIAQWLQDIQGLSYAPEIFADSRFANTAVLLHMVWASFAGDLIIWGGTFARIPEDVLEAGRIDGTNWWKEFIYIIVPVVWPTVALKLVLSFCGIFSASGAVFLLTKGNYGTQTLSNWMYMQVYNVTGGAGSSNVFNYMSAVGMAISVVALVLSRVIRRWTDKVFNEVEF